MWNNNNNFSSLFDAIKTRWNVTIDSWDWLVIGQACVWVGHPHRDSIPDRWCSGTFLKTEFVKAAALLYLKALEHEEYTLFCERDYTVDESSTEGAGEKINFWMNWTDSLDWGHCTELLSTSLSAQPKSWKQEQETWGDDTEWGEMEKVRQNSYSSSESHPSTQTWHVYFSHNSWKSNKIHLFSGTHLIFPVASQEVFGDVRRQNVLQQNPVEVLHGFDLLTLPLELVPPQEVQPTVIFILLQEDTE